MKKVISFSLWGPDPKYAIGAIKNAELALKYYPDWICRYHIGSSTPDGYIKRCSEMPAVCHYTDYKNDYFTKTDCTTCWFGCRGETQAPVLAKAKELIGV